MQDSKNLLQIKGYRLFFAARGHLAVEQRFSDLRTTVTCGAVEMFVSGHHPEFLVQVWGGT